ncbi:MAG: hypothetical protein KA797_06200 [Chitinophagales bacterium]|nr:hypothetical protein [Chitinophagales bacterium]
MKVFYIADDQNIDLKTRVDEVIEFIANKGYGDREQEMEFISTFFQLVFKNHPELTSFEWCQYQDYNDSFLYFDLEYFLVNSKYNIDVYGFQMWDEEEDWMYYFKVEEIHNETNNNNALNISTIDDDWETEREQLQIQTKSIKLATDCILVFLKALYDYYKPYYFIYIFGRRATVCITSLGIEINNTDIKYIDGEKYDNSYTVE